MPRDPRNEDHKIKIHPAGGFCFVPGLTGDTTHCETMPVRQAVDLTSIAQSNRYDCPAGILYAEGPQERRPQNKKPPSGWFLY